MLISESPWIIHFQEAVTARTFGIPSEELQRAVKPLMPADIWAQERECSVSGPAEGWLPGLSAPMPALGGWRMETSPASGFGVARQQISRFAGCRRTTAVSIAPSLQPALPDRRGRFQVLTFARRRQRVVVHRNDRNSSSFVDKFLNRTVM
ncbi:MAG: hypothetical protein CM15mP103_08030 [Gammaproteobacteria bacterium]|nr:MAG: hypothetical protein CM15mP103_08030 [Gammaproteobacteria bacterium]